MKKTISKVLGSAAMLAVALCAVFTIATKAEAAAPSFVSINNVGVSNGEYWGEDPYSAPSTTKPTSGGYVYYKDGVLTLHNYDMTVKQYNAIYANGDLTINLSDNSTIVQNLNDECIQVKGNLVVQGTGKLTITSSASKAEAIECDGDMTVKSGNLTVNCANANSILVNNGKTLTISGGTVTATGSEDHVIYAPYLSVTSGTLNVNGGREAAIYCYKTMSVRGGTLNLNTNKDGAAIYSGEMLEVIGGNIKIKAVASGIAVNGNCNLTGGNIEITAGYYCIESYQSSNIAVAGTDLTLEGNDGILAEYSTVLFRNDSVVDITSKMGRCVTAKILRVENTIDKVLMISKNSNYLAVQANTYLFGEELAISASSNSDGSNPLVVNPSNVYPKVYMYFRKPDMYVGGVPMAMGDYLAQGDKAASTYKLTDKYAHADLNGDTVELCLENFHITTTGSVVGIDRQSSLKLVLYGTNTITTETGAGIHLTNGSLSVLIGGTLDIKSGGDGIKLDSGDYRHSGAAININAGGMGINSTNTVNITSGELNIESGTYGISCNKFSMSGGKLLACGNTRAIDETMGFNYSPLPIFASTSVGGTLGTYKYANHNSYKAISIGHTVPPTLGIPGDMDGDGDKDTDDAVYLLLNVMFGETDYPIANPDKDLNNDGKIETNDAVYLLLHVMFGEGDYPL